MAGVLALVTFKVFPSQMGGQKGVALFYKHLAQHLKVTLAATPDNDAGVARSQGMHIKPLLYSNRKIYRNLGRLKVLEQLIRAGSIDAIIAEHSYPSFLGLWLRKRTGKPLIVHSHNIEALRFKQMGRWWWKQYLRYERWVHQQADFNFFISANDQEFAIDRFRLDPQKCAVITYGIEQATLPSAQDKRSLKKSLGFAEDELLFLFNGTLDYTPNVQAVHDIVHQINPRLSTQLANYTIVITGSRASAELVHNVTGQPHLVYRGFVEHIEPYYEAADLFLNPITNDSGVKTKIIEALSYNCSVLSFSGGASGIPLDLCGGKLITISNGDYNEFSSRVVAEAKKDQPTTPQAFYESYNWDNIAQKAAIIICKVITKHV